MGLLDDAIRDHLDLKRRHGADPAELERAEREALGPVRRKGDVAATGYADDDDVVVDESFDGDDDDAPAGSRPFAYDQAEDDWHYGADDSVAVDDPEASAVSDDVPEPEPEPRRRRSRRALADSDAEGDAEDDQPRGLAARFGLRGRRTEEDEHVEPEADEPPLGEDEPTRVHRAGRADRAPAPTGDETAEHDIESELHEPEAEDDDDMLEETPEFLQDAPDHDRLCFEQRPPRDFDFDE
jgi:hypothetical protein